MSGIAFTQDDLAEALEDLLMKRGLGVRGGYDLNWYVNASAPSGKQITAVCIPTVQTVLNKKEGDG